MKMNQKNRTMKQEEFKKWLENKYVDTPTTVANRISNCKNVEKYYGDLEIAYRKDKCNSIIELLNYSTEDERENKMQRHLVPINGNIRTGSATLKQAIKLYVDFREEENDTIVVEKPLLVDYVPDNKHDDLINILKKFVFKKKLHSDVVNLQHELTEYLNENYDSFTWETEYRITEKYKDSIDIVGFSKKFDFKHVIELDAHRADQVSKKFVSRMALLENEKVCYTAICYPGTKNMPIKETLKYFDYCFILANSLSNKKSFRGIILD
mgnify:FL=1